MCENPESGIKFARLKRTAFKQFLADRYSNAIGERILLFIENQFNSLYRIDFNGFIGVIMDFLNAGPDCYRKMLFASLGLQN